MAPTKGNQSNQNKADDVALPDPYSLLWPRVMRIDVAAKYISATTWQIETLIREKVIPSFIQGKRRVIDRLELDKYVDMRNNEALAGAV